MARSAIPAAAQTTRKHCSHSSVEITGSAVTRVKLKSAQRLQDRMDPLEKIIVDYCSCFNTHRGPPQGGAYRLRKFFIFFIQCFEQQHKGIHNWEIYISRLRLLSIFIHTLYTISQNEFKIK